MNAATRGRHDGPWDIPAAFGVAPLTEALLEDPVAFLSAEHVRQRALLGHLERLGRAPHGRGARVMAGALLRWLAVELPLHIADEEQSLYPRLRPHDRDGVVDRLAAEHRRDAQLARRLEQGLRALARSGQVTPDFAEDATGFARQHRWHLALEEASLLPLARQVLTSDAIAAMAAEIAARRRTGDP